MSFSFSDFTAALEGRAPIARRGRAGRAPLRSGPTARSPTPRPRRCSRSTGWRASPAPEWADFFIEAMTDYVVNGKAPRGYVDEANAAWLIDRDRARRRAGQPARARAGRQGHRARAERARLRSSPGRSPRSRNRCVRDGRVDARGSRCCFAGSSSPPAATARSRSARTRPSCSGGSRMPASAADNAPEWKTLFVQAVGNHLMAFSSYTPLERGEAARLEAFVNDHRSSVARLLLADARRQSAGRGREPSREGGESARGSRCRGRGRTRSPGARMPGSRAMSRPTAPATL